ncbi:glycosyl transferase [Mannheimia varigena]|uniref:glycosyltransferase family 4 protein n=1 Tax=Mannheimia varigena TaxID=85404 RepID=UPI00159D7E1E|nr:glycosyltransferase family 4 protein [Mannheimia varigena]QLB17523.1 glycosyl transferase [Mannheimia varigena]
MKYKLIVIGQIENKKTGLGKAINDFILHYNKKYGDNSLYQLDITKNTKFISNCFKILAVNCDKFYFTPSGSLFGNLRDCVYLFLMMLRGKKIITHFHNSSFKSIVESNTILNWINRCLYKRVDKIIILGNKQKAMFSSMQINEDKFRIIRNGIDENIFISEEMLIKKHSKKPINIIYFSNMIPEKGYQTVLSVAKLMRCNKDFHFYFSGVFFDPSLKDKFLQEIENMDNVTYINGVYGLEKAEVLAEMNILLFPSKYKDETLPISMLEAIANGLYIIVSDVGVISEVVNKETTSLLSSIDSYMLANIIEEKSKILNELNYNIIYYKSNYKNSNILEHLVNTVEE